VTGSALWFATRGSGAVSLVLLTSVLVLGIATTTRQQWMAWPRFVHARLHQNLSLLTLVFLAVHITTAVVDPYAHLGWRDAVVPFQSGYRPLWLGLGGIAMEGLVALAVSGAIRRRIGYRRWRLMHWIAYACWPVALMHGLGTGSDVRAGWFLWLDLLCIAAVFLALVGWRLPHGWPHGATFKLVTAVGSSLAVVGLVLWIANGPLGPGWARTAGTPVDLLHSGLQASPTAGQNETPSR
jgi:sulfoxide reductase heme-binding subunit YedZ